jgi:hypothetical protein
VKIVKGVADLSLLLKIFLIYSVTQINSRIVPQAKLTSFSHIFLISPFILLSSCHITFARTYAVDSVVKQRNNGFGIYMCSSLSAVLFWLKYRVLEGECALVIRQKYETYAVRSILVCFATNIALQL